MKELASSTDRQIFGKLGSVSLNDIIQLLGMSKRTATLELRRGSDRGRLYFREGQIIHSTVGLYEGEESFMELLGWGDAEFAVEEGIGSLSKISITKSTDALLLSTMTALDEVGRVVERPPVQIAPSISRRLPPGPHRRRARSFPKRALLLVGTFIAGSCVALAALSMGPAVWAETPWQNLPPVVSPLSARGVRPALLVRDAWTIASAAWERPTPIETKVPSAALPAPRRNVEPAYLTVVVDPWARVDIDGTAVGETPLGKLELPAGRHRITLSNDHVVGAIRDDIVIESGESLTKRYSFNDTGQLRLVVTPWADVSVDGRSIGQTPMGRVSVPAGSHSVRFFHPRERE